MTTKTNATAKKTVPTRKRKPKEQTTVKDITPNTTIAHVTAKKTKQTEIKQRQHKADTTKGQMIDTLSKQWCKRPMDERFISVGELSHAVNNRKIKSTEILVTGDDFKVSGEEGFMVLQAEGEEIPIIPTHAAWRQFCEQLSAPAEYISKLPVHLQKSIVDNHLSSLSSDAKFKILLREQPNDSDLKQLAAITSPTYGRVWDADVIAALEWLLKIDNEWKVPGEFDWTNLVQNPFVETTKGNTTLFASDRDVFAMLCKDDQPIEVGTNRDGTTDIYFPGFYVSNSETGHGGLTISTMMMRGVCANRCMWGCEGIKTVHIRHSKNAPDRFQQRAAEVMRGLTEADYMPFVGQIMQARETRLAKGVEEVKTQLAKLGFWKHEQETIINIGVDEDGDVPETAYDISNAITAFARRSPNNDKRLLIEAKAQHILKMAA